MDERGLEEVPPGPSSVEESTHCRERIWREGVYITRDTCFGLRGTILLSLGRRDKRNLESISGVRWIHPDKSLNQRWRTEVPFPETRSPFLFRPRPQFGLGRPTPTYRPPVVVP